MFTQVLWALDNDIDARHFERLCTDLMGREDYRNIIPVGGTHDRGRDAQIATYKGMGLQGEVTFFQYSLEDTWERKLDRELKKVKNNGHAIDHFVFVTTQSVTGQKRDALADEVKKQYGWQLTIYDREWFRHRLEELHTDLALKYLGVQPSIATNHTDFGNKPPAPTEQLKPVAWQLYAKGNYEAAAVAFKELIQAAPANQALYKALAWCQYSLFHYEEAMLSINKALELNEKDENAWSLKASILTEDAIRRRDRTNLARAGNIFQRIANNSHHWIDHYNYGNTLSELGQYETAKQEYLVALQYDANQAQVWKDLGTTYYHLHNHDEELKCYDQALTIDPNLTQGLLSKGVTLLMVFHKSEEASVLIAQAIEGDETLPVKWPYAWYWLARAYYECGEFKKALTEIETGLETILNNRGLLDLKGLVLSRLWKQDKQYVDEAISFFRERVDYNSQNYEDIAELAQLYEVTSQNDHLWDLLANYAKLNRDDLIAALELTAHSLAEVLQAFKYFPTYRGFRQGPSPIGDYIEALQDGKIELEPDFESKLYIVFAITFGLACAALQAVSPQERPAQLDNVYAIVQNSLNVSMPQMTKQMLRNVDRSDTKAVAERLSSIIVVWQTVPLVELSRQIGFLSALASIPIEVINQLISNKAEELQHWLNEIMKASLIQMNSILHIFKE